LHQHGRAAAGAAHYVLTELVSLIVIYVNRNAPLQMLCTNLDYDEHKGRIAIGRITSGRINKAETVIVCQPGARWGEEFSCVGSGSCCIGLGSLCIMSGRVNEAETVIVCQQGERYGPGTRRLLSQLQPPAARLFVPKAL